MDAEYQVKRHKEVKEILFKFARILSQELNGGPVVVVVGGSTDHDVPATAAGWANVVEGREPRHRDIVGLLQNAIEIESFQHFMQDEMFQHLKNIQEEK